MPAEHLFWTSSRAAGILALLLSTATVSVVCWGPERRGRARPVAASSSAESSPSSDESPSAVTTRQS